MSSMVRSKRLPKVVSLVQQVRTSPAEVTQIDDHGPLQVQSTRSCARGGGNRTPCARRRSVWRPRPRGGPRAGARRKLGDPRVRGAEVLAPVVVHEVGAARLREKRLDVHAGGAELRAEVDHGRQLVDVGSHGYEREVDLRPAVPLLGVASARIPRTTAANFAPRRMVS